MDLLDEGGSTVGILTIACLEGKEVWGQGTNRQLPTLTVLTPDEQASSVGASLQLLEEVAYDYRIKSGVAIQCIGPREHFDHRRGFAQAGRFAAKRATGTMTVVVDFADGTTGAGRIEIRSRKLDYESDYRSMLSRIASEAAELLLESFAASSLDAFEPLMMSDPETLYQRFAFMESLVQSDRVRNALHLIARMPHEEHRTSSRSVDPLRGSRPGARLLSQLVGPGPRQAIPMRLGVLDTLPRSIEDTAHKTSFDTLPNQFVRFALTHWRNLAIEVADKLGENHGHSFDRGRREAQVVVDRLEGALSLPAVKDAGPLSGFPVANQVLQGRAGYRDILEAFLLGEAGAAISWESSELFSAGQRNVADLYEYWVFLELVSIVEDLDGMRMHKRNLIKKSRGGMQLDLRRGGQSVVRGSTRRRGRAVGVELWFNKSFGRGEPGNPTSWTETMIPDCSIKVSPDGDREATWLHFDAKYRIQTYTSGMYDEDSEPTLDTDRPMSSDMAKMHAYLDAIRRSAGAYVLYPGNDLAHAVEHKRYHEVLPGLGAFVLRPTDSGHASAANSHALANFIDDVLDHVASGGTAAGRTRYWTRESYGTAERTRFDYSPILRRPAQDTQVLVGYVHGEDHMRWCLQNRLYNLRADEDRDGSVGFSSPELAAHYVLLYNPTMAVAALLPTTGSLALRNRHELEVDGYPAGGLGAAGRKYVCLHLGDEQYASPVDVAEIIRMTTDAARRASAPFLTTWSALVA